LIFRLLPALLAADRLGIIFWQDMIYPIFEKHYVSKTRCAKKTRIAERYL